MPTYYSIYRASEGWRWALYVRGNIVAASIHTFRTSAGAYEAVSEVKRLVSTAGVRVAR